MTSQRDYPLEESPLIEVGDAEIGLFNKVVYAVITLICVAYFFLNLHPSP